MEFDIVCRKWGKGHAVLYQEKDTLFGVKVLAEAPTSREAWELADKNAKKIKDKAEKEVEGADCLLYGIADALKHFK